MRRWNRLALVLWFVTCAAPVLLPAADPVPAPQPSAGPSPEEMLRFLHVPDGFTIELVAGPPLVERPIMASFDDRGRLFVTDSSGANLPGRELVKDPPHRVVILEDTDGDGRFDRSRVFADRIVFPQGLLWHDGAVYIASPPSLWKL